MLTRAASRKRAQRAHPTLTSCERCGATKKLQRHHPDHENAESVVVLCQSCHATVETEAGTWGRGKRAQMLCVICGADFTAVRTHTRNKTCSAACLSELGRRNAMKRWGVE